MFLTIFTFIAVLSVIVFAHELGHFWTAKKFGLIPEEFGFGLPPRVMGWYKNKEGKWCTVKGSKTPTDAADTIYSLNWLPMGGFVKLGEDDGVVDSSKNHFHNKPIWQRAVILLAGVTMNIILAAGLISFGFMVGMPQALGDLPASAKVSEQKVQVVEVLPDSPAAGAGLKIGDIVLRAGDVMVVGQGDLEAFNAANIGNEITYIIKRGNKEMTFNIAPVLIEETNAGGIGVGILETGLVRLPIHRAIWEGISYTFSLTWLIIVAFGQLFAKLFTSGSVSADVAGPVGIAVLTGQVARMGFVYIIQFAAMLSINLAIINALPFPALDGGRVLFLLIEKIKGSPVKKEVEGTIHYIGFALLMLLVLVVTFKDIDHYTGFFKSIVGFFS